MRRNQMAPKQVVLAFVRKINEHDSEGLARLMTEDHVFVDSLGRSFKGRREMKNGWEKYFTLFSDYTITIVDTFAKHGTIILIGSAAGIHVDHNSHQETKWKIPAAWKAVVTNGLVSEWHVFADNSETMKLLTGN